MFNVNVAERHPESGRQLLPGRPAAGEHPSQNQVRRRPARSRCSGSSSTRGSQQPYQMQTNAGWSHELTSDTVVGGRLRQLARPRPELPAARQPADPRDRRTRGASRRIVPALEPEHQRHPAGGQPRHESTYNALIIGGAAPPVERHRLHRRRTRCQKGISNIGNAADELNTANIQDPEQPVRRSAPVRPEPDHRRAAPDQPVGASFQMPCGIRIAPIFLFRSALPVEPDRRPRPQPRRRRHSTSRPRRIAVDRRSNAATGTRPTIEEFGALRDRELRPRHVAQTQINMRVLEGVPPRAAARNVEAIGEVFNLFNAHQPERLPTATAVNVLVATTGAAECRRCSQPTTFSGDFRRPEQRVGQLGFGSRSDESGGSGR